MELIDHIRKISFIFFVVIGIAHFTAGFFAVNGYFSQISSLVNRVLFIPFVLAVLTYGLSNFKYHLLENGKTSKNWDYAFITIGIIIFTVLIAIEFFVIDSTHPLLP